MVVLRTKLSHLLRSTAQRQQMGALYDQHLAGISYLNLPRVAPGATHVYHLCVVHAPKRERQQRHLTQQGISALIHYLVPPHRQQPYTPLTMPEGSFPLAEEPAKTCLSLPMWPSMS